MIVRDPRESAQKCSLTPLRGVEGVRFVTHRGDQRVDVGRRILLSPGGEELTRADRGPGLLVIDCAWRKVEKLRATIDGELVVRRLPRLATAYPRKSRVHEDPEEGLASIEAIYAAWSILVRPEPRLLVGYRWADEFLRLNPALERRAERAS